MKSPRMSSTREAHNFVNPAKALIRQRHLTAVRDAWLCDNITGQLRCDWVELAGESVHETISLLESANTLRPGGFIGVDTNRALVQRMRTRRPDLRWLEGDLRHHVSWLCQHAEVGVVNFDSYLEVGTKQAAAFFTTSRPIIQRAVKRFGSCVLFSNNDLDSVFRHPNSYHHARPDVAVRAHTEQILERLADYVDRRALPPFDVMLPPGFEEKVNSRRFQGHLGAYWIYSGGNNGHRMIELALIL